MARKSNKTAHVLNLLAGHEAQPAADETPDNRPSAGDEISDTDSSADVQETKEASSPAESRSAAGSTQVQNISVIDTTGEDPVANLIQQNLSAQFEGDGGNISMEASEDIPDSSGTPSRLEAADIPSSSDMAVQASASSDSLSADTAATAEESVPLEVQTTADVTVPTPDPVPAPTPVSVPTPDPVSSVPIPDPESVPGPGPTTFSKKTAEPEPEPEPEPDFIYLNVMETIVNDKIIYYMRQFDVCTCDRCVADTIALTMNGLTPKYIVTSPAAVDPLIGFYTNKLISDITVEATKACITVKDNPRH